MKRVIAALASSALLVLLVVAPVAAHSHAVSLTCDGGASVNLTNYNTTHANSVVVTLDGDEVANESDFGSSFSYSNSNLDAYLGHTLHVVVKAWDDTTGSQGFTFDVTKSLEPCKQHNGPDVQATGCTDIDGKGSFTISGLEDGVVVHVDGKDYTANGSHDIAPGDYPWTATFGEDVLASGTLHVGDCPVLPDKPTFRLTCGNITVAGITEGWQFVVEPGELVLDNGRNALAPGDYTYKLIFDGVDRADGSFTIAACGEVQVFAEPCPNAQSDTAAVIVTPSRLRIVGVLALLTIKVDGQVVTPDSNGDVVVTPGLRHVTVLAADGETVLFDGDVDCPTCETTTTNVPTPPPTDTVGELPQPTSTSSILPVLLLVAVIGGGVLVTTRKRS